MTIWRTKYFNTNYLILNEIPFYAAFCFLILINLAMTGCSSNDYRLFTAGYTRDPGEAGFNIYDFNPASGELTIISGHNAGPNPSYFCYLPEKRLFYVGNEVREFKGEPGGV